MRMWKWILALVMALMMLFGAAMAEQVQLYYGDVPLGNSSNDPLTGKADEYGNITVNLNQLVEALGGNSYYDAASGMFTFQLDTTNLRRAKAQVSGETVARPVKISGDWTYYVREDNTASIVGYLGSETLFVEIPNEIDGLTVTQLGRPASDYGFDVLLADPVTREKLGEGYMLLDIDWELTDKITWVFDEVEEVTLPDTLRHLGMGVFKHLKAEEFVLPEGLEVIEAGFMEYGYFEKSRLPSTLREVGPGAFNSSCYNMDIKKDTKEYRLPEGLGVIEPYAVGKLLESQQRSEVRIILPEGCVLTPGCFSRTNNTYATFVLPQSLTEVPAHAFYDNNCNAVIFQGNNVTTIGEQAFADMSNLQEITLPEGVTTIGTQAFYKCGRLEKVVLPASVTEIGKHAFANCPDNLVLYVVKDSYAHTWAVENGFKVKTRSK